jgi:hypothetical protein
LPFESLIEKLLQLRTKNYSLRSFSTAKNLI